MEGNAMCKENGRENERQVEENFDRFVRQELLSAANEMRKEKGLPPLTEDEANALDGLSGPDGEENGAE